MNLPIEETVCATDATNSATDATKPETNFATNATDLNEDEYAILTAIRKKPDLTQKQMHDETKIPLGTIKRMLPRLQAKGKLERVGNRRQGHWKVLDGENGG